MLYNLSPFLRQRLEDEGYSSAMLVAIDKLQDKDTTLEQYEGRTKNILKSDKYTKREKEILKKDWFIHAKAIADFNAAD